MFRRTFLKLLFAASKPSFRNSSVGLFLSPSRNSIGVCDLRCEYRIDPIDVEASAPRLSWMFEKSPALRRGVRQTAYRILVSTTLQRLQQSHGDLWDSGIVRTHQSSQIPYEGIKLETEQTCYWKVRVLDNRELWSDWSEPASWTMGLLQPCDWTGSWIGGLISSSSSEISPDPWLRKRLSLDSKPERCLIHVASIGYHELYVNGAKIGAQVLAPSVSNLKHRVRYVTYDITNALRVGDNVIALWLGTSWSIFPAYRTEDRPEQPLVKVQGSLRFHDGDSRHIVSDATWKTTSSPNRLVGTWKVHDYGGERYDARRQISNWAAPETDDSSWQQAWVFKFDRVLSSDSSAGNVLAHPVTPVGVATMPNGSYRIDMGINYAGWFQIKVAGQPGTEVHFEFSENESEASTYAQRSAYVIGPDEKGTFCNRFNYMSGRWITVSGLNSAPKLADICGWNVRSPFKRTTGFSCDQPLLNQIYETTLWTFENLALGNYIVDCPHRERTGYGDAEEVLRTSVNNYALASFLSQWAEDWRDVQRVNGDIPHSAPTEIGGGGPAWSAFSITLPWRLYQRYGDLRVLHDGFPTMQRWLDFMDTHAEDDMLVRWGGKWGFLGDWQWPKFSVERSQMERAGKSLGDTPESLFFNNCYWVYALQTTANVADTIGQHALAVSYRNRAQRIRSKVHARFFNAEDHSYVNGFPAYLAIALRAEIPPPPLRGTVWKRLEDEIIVNRKGHIWAGIIGGATLIDLLLDYRRNDLIYAMANKTDYPSWGEMLKLGHTTFTEGWGGTSSGLHSSFLYLGSWFIEGLAGIRQPSAGFQHFEIDPCIDLKDGPKCVNAWVDTEYGRIVSSWERRANSVLLETTVPPNTTCRLRLRNCEPHSLLEGTRKVTNDREGVRLYSQSADATVLELQSGSYTFTSFFS